MQNDSSKSQNVSVRFRSLMANLLAFNGLYKLPIAPFPSVSNVVQDERNKIIAAYDVVLDEHPPVVFIKRRLEAFKATILKEVQEVEDIMDKLSHESYESPTDFLTDLADWLCDMQIYCASEAVKFGIPNDEILGIIMDSNMSKLQADGSVKYDADGKVEKGPHYWKPEPQIKALLIELQQPYTGKN